MLYYRVAAPKRAGRAEKERRVVSEKSGEWCPLRGQSGLRCAERCGKNLPQANLYFIKTIVRDGLSQIVGEEEIKRTGMLFTLISVLFEP